MWSKISYYMLGSRSSLWLQYCPSLYQTKIETVKTPLFETDLEVRYSCNYKQNNAPKNHWYLWEYFLLQSLNQTLILSHGSGTIYLPPSRGPTVGICINVLAPPWSSCNIYFFKKTNARQMPGGGDACGWNWLSYNWCATSVEWAKKQKRNMDPTFNLHFISHHTSDEISFQGVLLSLCLNKSYLEGPSHWKGRWRVLRSQGRSYLYARTHVRTWKNVQEK